MPILCNHGSIAVKNVHRFDPLLLGKGCEQTTPACNREDLKLRIAVWQRDTQGEPVLIAA
jgi:hypothetical protein